MRMISENEIQNPNQEVMILPRRKKSGGEKYVPKSKRKTPTTKKTKKRPTTKKSPKLKSSHKDGSQKRCLNCRLFHSDELDLEGKTIPDTIPGSFGHAGYCELLEKRMKDTWACGGWTQVDFSKQTILKDGGQKDVVDE